MSYIKREVKLGAILRCSWRPPAGKTCQWGRKEVHMEHDISSTNLYVHSRRKHSPKYGKKHCQVSEQNWHFILHHHRYKQSDKHIWYSISLHINLLWNMMQQILTNFSENKNMKPWKCCRQFIAWIMPPAPPFTQHLRERGKNEKIKCRS